MKKLILAAALLMLAHSFIYAQSYISISGKIIDKKTKEALSFCSIGFPNQTLGTVSNEDGFFELHIPKDFINDTLYASYVGYFPFKKKVAELSDTTLLIELSPKSELLDEVLVLKDNAAFARNLVKKAAKKINKNYPTRPHLMKGFYRGIYMQDGEYVSLEEAAVSIESKGYRQHLSKTIVRVDQLRQTEDGRVVGWFQALFYWLLDKNGIYSILNLEPVKKKGVNFLHESGDYYYSIHELDITNITKKRNYENFVFIKDQYNQDYYDYRVTAITEYEGEKVYVVEYSNPFRDKMFWGGGKMIISKSTLAIIDFQHEVRSSYESLNRYEGELVSSHRVKYKKVGDEYLLQMIHLKAGGDDNSPFSRKTDSLDENDGKITQERLLIITDTFVGKRNYDSIKKSEAVHKDTGIAFVDTEFNPDFWKNYNILLDAPLEKKVMESIKKQNLDNTQFTQK